MIARSTNVLRVLAAVLVAGVVAIQPCQPASAQVASNISADVGARSLGTSVSQAGNTYDIGGGTVAGNNLFQSFSQFTVGTGDVANFNGPAGIANIVSRVTGGTVSTIDGAVVSTIAGANLVLVNPSGLHFGPNASIQVDGDFHATSANAVGFSGGFTFDMNTTQSTLAVADISQFGFINRLDFNSSTPGPITVESPGLTWQPGTNVTTTAPGATISIVGGKITLGAEDGSAPAYVLAPNAVDGGGNIVVSNIRIASVASSGQAVLGNDGAVDVSSFSALGDVLLQGGTFVDGGNVVVRGANVAIHDATILPGAFSVFGITPPPDGGMVDIAATNTLDIQGTAPDPFFGAPVGVLVFSGLDAGFPEATVPDVKLAALSISMTGASGITVNRFLGGPAGTVEINADQLNITNGASVSLVNFYDGPGGALKVNVPTIVLDGTGSTGFTGFAAQSQIGGGLYGMSGTIDVKATNRLDILGGAEISTESRSLGPSGNIALTVGDLNLDASKIAAQSTIAGDSGNVTVNATGKVTLSGGAIISAATFGGGRGGNVAITAAQGLDISGERSGIASQTTPPPQAELDGFAQAIFGASWADLAAFFGLPPDGDLFEVLRGLNGFGFGIPESQLQAGDGGSITINALNLNLSGLNAAIDSSTAWDGNAGRVDIAATNLTVGAGATIGSRSGIPNLDTGALSVGSGRAGTVALAVLGDMTVAGAGARVSTDTRGTGNAGNVEIQANHLLIADGGKVSSSSGGTGLAGDIRMVLGDSLDMRAGTIATEALSSDGGNIWITAPRIVHLIDSEITTSVGSGQGNGGNITIDPQFVVLQNSKIIANAYGGNGGNINIVCGYCILDVNSIIEASSAFGVDGIVSISAPDSDISASLAVLPATYLDAASNLQAGCGAARAGMSSLTQVGRGGVPPDPGSYLPSQYEGAVGANPQGSLIDARSLYASSYYAADDATTTSGCAL